MYECHLQVVYYFTNFQLAPVFLGCKTGKGVKLEGKMGEEREVSLRLWPPIFFRVLCERQRVLAGN